MSSVPQEPTASTSPDDPELVESAGPADLTARARVRDAAIRRFAEAGVAGTSLRAIAGEAGVSPGLVVHHFGSKDGLRVACDEHVAALIRQRKQSAMGGGLGLDAMGSLRAAADGPPVLAYLARTLIDGSPHVTELVDELVADATGYLAQGEASGHLEPTDDRRGRAVVLTLWSLGALVLHDHLRRLLGADLLGDPTEVRDYMLPALEIMGRGVLTEEAYAAIRAGLEGTQEGGT